MVGKEQDDSPNQFDEIQQEEGDESSSSHVVVVVGANNPDEWPHLVLRGPLADLGALRHAGSHSTFFTGPRELLQEGAVGIPCRVKWNGDEESEGELFITISQVIFGSSASSLEDASSDWAIGATCIHLHAMADDPEPSIYLQVDEGGDDEDSLEVTLIPLDHEACQTIFDGLCKLVARHPLQLDDDDGSGFEGHGAGFDTEDMIWAPSAGMRSMDALYDNPDEEGATDSERAAMLHRLDNILVVLPEFEVRDGQFDDADDDDSEGEPE